MSPTTQRHWPTSRTLLLLFAVVVMVVALLIWWWGQGGPSMESQDATEAEVVGKSIPPKSSSSRKPSSTKVMEQTEQAAEQPSMTLDVFSPERIIDRQDCFVRTRRGHVEDIAVVVLPEADGSRFAVLDGTGMVFDGELPFSPASTLIGKRRDGSTLVGFGDLSSELWKKGNVSRPMRVYLDGQIIFESVKATEFGIAADGSSFFVVEPLMGNVSNLRIHNLELGVEHHYEHDHITMLANVHMPFIGRYTKHQAEVYLGSVGYPMRWFYPVDGGMPRVIKVDRRASLYEVFASSRHGYFAHGNRDRGVIVISKREFRHDGTGEPTSIELWNRTLDLDGFSEMKLSDDGDWLMLDARNLHILNTTTGETVFAFPTEANLSRLALPEGAPKEWLDDPYGYHYEMYREAALKRLSSVLPTDATVGHVGSIITHFEWIWVHGGLLIMERGLHWSEPLSRRSWNIFDMSEIQIDSQPKMRIEFDGSSRCASGNVPGRGLQEVDGRLTYLTERVTFDSD